MKPQSHDDAIRMIPEYPRTRHLPHKATAKRDDLVCTLEECKAIWTNTVAVQEKIDGAQCRMAIRDGYPLIGNRNHIINKAYTGARTAAKLQFSSIWTWWYDNNGLFKSLQEAGPYSVYGDWMFMQHGMHYDLLPSLFVAYDVYNYEVGEFLDPKNATTILQECGFSVVPLLHYGLVEGFDQLEKLANQSSAFASNEKREGVYLKVTNGEYVTDRFKMVREGFEQGKHLSKTKITRNKVKK